MFPFPNRRKWRKSYKAAAYIRTFFLTLPRPQRIVSNHILVTCSHSHRAIPYRVIRPGARDVLVLVALGLNAAWLDDSLLLQ